MTGLCMTYTGDLSLAGQWCAAFAGPAAGALYALAVDVVLVEHRQNVVPVAVFANQPHRLQRQANVHFCQRQQDVERRAAG